MPLQRPTLIGRQLESQKLTKAFESSRAELIAVYGRRRIGKTYLIRSFFLEKDCIYLQMTGIHKGLAKVQLQEFSTQIAQAFLPQSAKLEAPSNWMNAFKLLTEILDQQDKTKKIVIFLDEFPWMAGRSTNLIQAFEYYWNQYWCHNPNLKIIICGSAASWIIRNIINNRGGLHNRVTLRLPMAPFNLAETKAYLQSEGIGYDDFQTLEIYMCLGGIPYYLTMLDKSLSAAQNINQICFQKAGALVGEFQLLFASLFKNADIYTQLIRVIGTKRNGISREEIESKIKYKGGTLTKQLTELEQIGFIISYTPWNRLKKGLYYQVVDEYILFYLSWIQPAFKRNLQTGIGTHYWESVTDTPGWRSWSGYAFEAVCFKHLQQIRKALNIPEIATAYPWRYVSKSDQEESGAQIDLVMDRHDHIINICEIKFRRGFYTLDKVEAEKLMHRVNLYREVTKTQKLIFISLITTFGVQASVGFQQLINSTVVLSDLFKEV